MFGVGDGEKSSDKKKEKEKENFSQKTFVDINLLDMKYFNHMSSTRFPFHKTF